MKHYFIKPFMPVFEREKILKKFHTWSGKTTEIHVPKYKRWSYNYWLFRPTTIPKKIWAIIRAKVRRTGQLELGLFLP